MNCDITVICESHLKDDAEITVPGYQWFGYNRTFLNPQATRGSGGVGVLVKHDIVDSYIIQIVEKSFEGILLLRFTDKLSDFSFLVCGIYLPPERSSRGDTSQQFYDALLTQFYHHWQNEITLICGDFNGRIGRKTDSNDSALPNRSPLDLETNKFGDHLLDFLQDTNLCVVNGRFPQSDNFTCVSTKGKSVVDYILTPSNCFHKFKSCDVTLMSDCLDAIGFVSRRIPDHSFVKAVIVSHENSSSVGKTKLTDNGSYIKDRRYVLDGVPLNFLENPRRRNAIVNLCDRYMYEYARQESVDDAYEQIVYELRNEMDNTLTFRDTKIYFNGRKRLRKKPFWNAQLQNLWSIQRQSERKYLRCKGNRERKRTVLHQYKSDRANFDKAFRQLERTFNRDKMNRIEQLRTDDPKAFWNEIRNLGPGKKIQNCIQAVAMPDGSISHDKTDILTQWKCKYKTLYNVTNVNSFDQNHFDNIQGEWDAIQRLENADVQRYDQLSLNADISRLELVKAICKLKLGKACGLDKIPNEILKSAEMTDILLNLFNKVFHNGGIPKMWNTSIINPILKPGKDRKEPLSYRGISLNSTVSKLYSAILNCRLMTFCDDNDLIVDEQNGFRANRNCIDHIYGLTTILRNRKLQKQSTFLCFIDFSKAFDAINRTCLFTKLYRMGIRGKFLRTVVRMYTNTNACVKINGHLTDPFETTSGVRQGDCLSPTLFSLYINDLALEIQSSGHGVAVNGEKISILLYADDIVLISDSEVSLQRMIEILERWCAKWRMRINADKTQVMHCRRKNDAKTDFVFTYNHERINVTEQYRYLGVHINDTLDYTVTATELAKSASRALAGILTMHFKTSGLCYNTFCKLYEAKVAPIMDYACCVWGFKTYKEIEKVHYRAMRAFLGVGKFAALPSIEGDMGWAPVQVRFHTKMIGMWTRLCQLPRNRITNRIFRWDYELALNGKDNWARNVRNILVRCEMAPLFETVPESVLSKANIRSVVKNVNNQLISAHTKEWLVQINEMPKLRTYRTLKNSFGVEDYVNKVQLSRSQRSVIARLRNGSFPINIEIGRYRGIPLDDRICYKCNSNSIENEEHFMCVCPAYEEQRTGLIRDIRESIGINLQTALPNDVLKCMLMNPLIARPVANYVKLIYNVRNEI